MSTMSANISSLDPSKVSDTEEFLGGYYPYLVDKAREQHDITTDMHEILQQQMPETMDELDECYKELKRCIDNKLYYQLVARVAKAEIVIDAEPDMEKRDVFIKKMKELIAQMEPLRPK